MKRKKMAATKPGGFGCSRCLPALLAIASLLGIAPIARAQVYPILDCVEYFTPPLPPACGFADGRGTCAPPAIGVPYNQIPAGGTASSYPPPTGDSGSQAYLARYSYYSVYSTVQNIPYGLLTGNFYAPNQQMYPGQPIVFYPGLHAVPVIDPADFDVVWFLNGNSSSPSHPVGAKDSNGNTFTSSSARSTPVHPPIRTSNMW
jgi:hypothetical protein